MSGCPRGAWRLWGRIPNAKVSQPRVTGGKWGRGGSVLEQSGHESCWAFLGQRFWSEAGHFYVGLLPLLLSAGGSGFQSVAVSTLVPAILLPGHKQLVGAMGKSRGGSHKEVAICSLWCFLKGWQLEGCFSSSGHAGYGGGQSPATVKVSSGARESAGSQEILHACSVDEKGLPVDLCPHTVGRSPTSPEVLHCGSGEDISEQALLLVLGRGRELGLMWVLEVCLEVLEATGLAKSLGPNSSPFLLQWLEERDRSLIQRLGEEMIHC